MRYIIILIILVSTKGFPEYSSETQFKDMLKEAKQQIDFDCFTCYKSSVLEINSAIKKLEIIIDKTKNDELLTLALEALGDGYGELAGYVSKENIEKSNMLLNKRGEMYQKAYESKPSSCLRPNLLIKHFYRYQSKTAQEQLLILQPFLNQQSNFFQALYLEGNILIKMGSVKKGLDALETAVAIALYKDALYNGVALAKILKKHGRNEAAKKIMALHRSGEYKKK